MNYTVNTDNLTIRDVIALQKAGGDIESQLPILRKVIIMDGDVEDLPAKHLRHISAAIVKQMQGDNLGN